MHHLQVAFHNERTEEVGKDGYRVRVPKTATVGQLLEQVRQRVGEAAGTGPLRLLEVRDCRICQARNCPAVQPPWITVSPSGMVCDQQTSAWAFGMFTSSLLCCVVCCSVRLSAADGPSIATNSMRRCLDTQVFSPDKPVLDLDDHAWTLRAEPVPADEITLAEDEKLLHVYHVTFDEARKKACPGFGIVTVLLGMSGIALQLGSTNAEPSGFAVSLDSEAPAPGKLGLTTRLSRCSHKSAICCHEMCTVC